MVVDGSVRLGRRESMVRFVKPDGVAKAWLRKGKGERKRSVRVLEGIIFRSSEQCTSSKHADSQTWRL